MTEAAALVPLAARYERLAIALSLFPLCYLCGRDLRADRLATLNYNSDRNRFACPTCPEAPRAA